MTTQTVPMTCDFCEAIIPAGEEVFINVIGYGEGAEEEYRCESCESRRVRIAEPYSSRLDPDRERWGI